MRLPWVGGLLAVSQDYETKAVEPECGWVLAYETPIDELSDAHKRFEEYKKQRLEENNETNEVN